MIKLVVVALLISSNALADQYVNGYVRKDGTYVQPHIRTTPNSYRADNYSSQQNQNPYTGQKGYDRNEYSNPPQYNQPHPYPQQRPYNGYMK